MLTSVVALASQYRESNTNELAVAVNGSTSVTDMVNVSGVAYCAAIINKHVDGNVYDVAPYNLLATPSPIGSFRRWAGRSRRFCRRRSPYIGSDRLLCVASS